MILLIILYIILGYWATGKTLYANSVLIGTGQAIFLKKYTMGAILGWILIPIAIIKSLVGR